MRNPLKTKNNPTPSIKIYLFRKLAMLFGKKCLLCPNNTKSIAMARSKSKPKILFLGISILKKLSNDSIFFV